MPILSNRENEQQINRKERKEKEVGEFYFYVFYFSIRSYDEQKMK
jgi:hypothetical protein